MSMPPMQLEYEGRDIVTRFLDLFFRSGRKFDLVPTRANGQPAFATYVRTSTGIRPGTSLIVIALAGDRISAITRFEGSVLPRFGLPQSLPSP
jgi:RNA polymerase sigma-70 factor (ECF subfamily)